MTFFHPISFYTLLKKEIVRFFRIWPQTFMPPLITSTLYFLIFGHFMGELIGPIRGVSYIEYIAPGLIMMSVITNAYGNVVSSLFGNRFQKCIEELLISPISHAEILAGYVAGGVFRGLIVGATVSCIALFFTHLPIKHLGITCITLFLSAILFSLAGFTNALYAKNFDDITVVPTFILTPLTYLGGIFYSIHQLPPFWRHLSHYNPIAYIVDTLRYGILGSADLPLTQSYIFLILAIIFLTSFNLWLLKKGQGIRT